MVQDMVLSTGIISMDTLPMTINSRCTTQAPLKLTQSVFTAPPQRRVSFAGGEVYFGIAEASQFTSAS